MRALREDAGTAFLRALRVHFIHFAGPFRIEELSSRSWASATFSGARHKVAFSLAGEGAAQAAEAFAASVGEAEFDLRGHIVADIALVEQSSEEDRVLLRVEALTVEDD